MRTPRPAVFPSCANLFTDSDYKKKLSRCSDRTQTNDRTLHTTNFSTYGSGSTARGLSELNESGRSDVETRGPQSQPVPLDRELALGLIGAWRNKDERRRPAEINNNVGEISDKILAPPAIAREMSDVVTLEELNDEAPTVFWLSKFDKETSEILSTLNELGPQHIEKSYETGSSGFRRLK